MTAESFETIMARNNTTTVPAAQRVINAGAKKPAETVNASVKKNNALIAAATLMLCFCLVSSASAASIQKRAVVDTSSVIDNNTNNSAPTKTCQQNTPCGWAIYIPFTRRIDYFMKNTCDCSSNFVCLKTDDDLSVNAYVYRCRPKPTSTTTWSPSQEK